MPPLGFVLEADVEIGWGVRLTVQPGRAPPANAIPLSESADSTAAFENEFALLITDPVSMKAVRAAAMDAVMHRLPGTGTEFSIQDFAYGVYRISACRECDGKTECPRCEKTGYVTEIFRPYLAGICTVKSVHDRNAAGVAVPGAPGAGPEGGQPSRSWVWTVPLAALATIFMVVSIGLRFFPDARGTFLAAVQNSIALPAPVPLAPVPLAPPASQPAPPPIPVSPPAIPVSPPAIKPEPVRAPSALPSPASPSAPPPALPVLEPAPPAPAPLPAPVHESAPALAPAIPSAPPAGEPLSPPPAPSTVPPPAAAHGHPAPAHSPPAPTASAPPAAVKFPPIVRLQGALTQLGFYHGPPTGTLDGPTRQALADFLAAVPAPVRAAYGNRMAALAEAAARHEFALEPR